jgi:hypothetical protein
VLVTSTDFWCTALDVEGKEAYGTPVRIFDPDDVRSLVEKARGLGFRLDGSLDLRCGEPVVTWKRVGLSYTFVNVVLQKPPRRRDRLSVLGRIGTRGPTGPGTVQTPNGG